MPVKSSGFAIGNLRARENTLLKQNDFFALIAVDNTDSLAALLRDKGIGNAAKKCDVPEMLKDDTEKLWSYLTEIAPDMIAFEPFIYENDFHNLKAVIKAVVRSRDFEEYVLKPSVIDVSKIEKAVKEKKFDILPKFMTAAASDAYEIMTGSGDSQLADGMIDAACMTAQLEAAEKSRNATVLELVRTIVFYNNVKVALRAAKAGKGADFLENTLTESGVLSKKALLKAAVAGQEKVIELLSTARVYGGDEAAHYFEESPSRFEKYVDDRIMNIAKKCKYSNSGTEPLIGYMIARQTEIKNIRIIYSGIKTGQSADTIKERLREFYG